MEEGRSALKILTGKLAGKRPLGRPRRKWEDNIRMDLEEICINEGDWVDSAQDMNYWRALVNAALKLRVPLAMELKLVSYNTTLMIAIFSYLEIHVIRYCDPPKEFRYRKFVTLLPLSAVNRVQTSKKRRVDKNAHIRDNI